MKSRILIPSLIIILLFTSASCFLLFQQVTANTETKIHPVKMNMPRQKPMLIKEMNETLTIGAVGDILIHDVVYQDAFQGGTYQFDPIFQYVKEMMEKPDILTANQESTLGGTELGLSSYPLFNSPHEVGNALVNAGVDIVSTANNHSLDKGEKGIDSETAYFDRIGLPHVGSFTNPADQQSLRIIDKNGIKLAFLSYTYGTNGIPLPTGKSFLVNIIDRKKMAQEIQQARSQADVVIMSIHWGDEYHRMPTNQQKDLAGLLINEGVDIIFGSHPHVLQPMEWISAKNGRKGFVIYSLGNFISGQEGDYKDIGGMVTITISKHNNKINNSHSIEIANPEFIPTYVSSTHCKDYRIVPLKNAGQFGLIGSDQKYTEVEHHMTQWIQP
jgi:poly-gamma-glutamate capsule biosynthesis protein CapA/YwtB (metallophosphatase superfamily)